MLLDSDHAPGGVIVYYADGNEEIIHVNQYVIDLFECDSADDFLDLVHGSFRFFVHGEDLDSAEDSIWGQVEKHDNLDHINYRIQTKTGKLVTIEDFGRLVEFEDGRPVFHVFITEAEQRGAVDWLTGLPGMVRFHELAEMGAATMWGRGDVPVAVALDLVGMKAYNTQYGRDEGDNLLIVFADLLRKHFGSEACSRFGEDHFYAFASLQGFDQKMESLFDDFGMAKEGRTLPVRAGAYSCDPEDDIVGVGFDRAKIACDLDRKMWLSHLVWFNNEMRSQEELRIHVLDSIDQAIAERWVRPHYQTIVRACTSNIAGEEALARWVDPEYGELTPNMFVPVLEEAGLLQKLDMHMVDCVIEDMQAKREAGMPLVPVSVNVSLRDLDQLDIAGEFARKADAAGMPHRFLRVEFTESAISDDPELFKSQVEALHEAGFEVWMDDFGSGYSSLNALKAHNFDFIKLDMDFIGAIHNAKAREIVAGVIRVAKKLGVGTLAEGVETERQALFLESIGCDMVQGYYYTRPLPLEQVIERFSAGQSPMREKSQEFDYWNEIGAVDLLDPLSNVEGRSADGSRLTEFPAGVMEERDGEWRVVRANAAYREFLDRGNVVPLECSNLQANRIGHDVDVEFVNAAARSLDSHAWERVAGRLEYGTGLQFYTRHVRSVPGADAFAIASVPNMLGTALGTYGDVPVAYAVLRVKPDESGDSILDAEYVYANFMYCDLCGYSEAELPGSSFIELAGDAGKEWLTFFYHAAILREDVHDVKQSVRIGHWLSFNVSPSPVEGCCVFAFTVADAERRERDAIVVGRNTSDFIVNVARVFDAEKDYSASMNAVLEMISRVIHPKRLFVFERGHGTDLVTFEWCAEGFEKQANIIQETNAASLMAWDDLAEGEGVIYIPDISVLEQRDESLYRKLKREGIERLLAAPLYDGETVIGNLVAENYVLDESVDMKRLLESIASFISSRIVNQRLLMELERVGAHDSLTGLLNRRGFDSAIEERMAASPNEPYVLALLDIDDFKTMNDLHGHEVGDAALRALAATVIQNVPKGAVVGRNGGDEFVIMLFGPDSERADEVFGNLAALDLSCEYNGRSYGLSLSLGYVGWPDQAEWLNDAYTKADAALYAVKLADKASALRYSRDVESQYRSQLGFTPRDIAENIPGAIMVHRAGDDGEILFANNELIKLFECESLTEFMEYTGGTFSGAVHPDDAIRVYKELTSQLTLDDVGAKNYSNFRIVTKKGNVRHVAENGHLVDVAEVGKVFYVLLVNRDERDIAWELAANQPE